MFLAWNNISLVRGLILAVSDTGGRGGEDDRVTWPQRERVADKLLAALLVVPFVLPQTENNDCLLFGLLTGISLQTGNTALFCLRALKSAESCSSTADLFSSSWGAEFIFRRLKLIMTKTLLVVFCPTNRERKIIIIIHY